MVNGRRKGHQTERDIVNEFKSRGQPAKRHLEYQTEEAFGVDVITNDFVVQCKRGRKYAPIQCYKEIKKDLGKVKLLVTKADHEETMVVLSFEDFLDLVYGIGERINLSSPTDTEQT